MMRTKTPTQGRTRWPSRVTCTDVSEGNDGTHYVVHDIFPLN